MLQSALYSISEFTSNFKFTMSICCKEMVKIEGIACMDPYISHTQSKQKVPDIVTEKSLVS